MDGVSDLLKQLVNPESIISYGGIYLLLFVVFAETGLFFGFFLAGDSLLFTAGLLCASGILNIHPSLLVILITAAALLGNMVGYAFGKKVGGLLFMRKSGFFFRQQHLEAANEFYSKHGKKTIILSRFLPIVRTFVPIVAGILRLNYLEFFIYSMAGAFFWVIGLVMTGYYLGEYFPKTKDYLGYIILFLVVVTSLPVIFKFIRSRLKRKKF